MARAGRNHGPIRYRWRAARASLAWIIAFVVLCAAAIPALAWMIYAREHSLVLPILLGVLALAAVLYGWRFGLHPRLTVTDDAVIVYNPIRRTVLDLDEITLVAPGGDGLLIATEDTRVDAWCVQKSNRDTKKGRQTRADRIADTLLALLDERDPPWIDTDRTDLRLRRAHAGEAAALTAIEQAASMEKLAEVFPPTEFPYPTADVRKRWYELLHDPAVQVRVLEQSGKPVGFIAYSEDTIRHLAVHPDRMRQGLGQLLLDHAAQAVFDNGHRAARLWVLEGNTNARDFYRSQDWVETSERRTCEFAPYPSEILVALRNPAAARRSY